MKKNILIGFALLILLAGCESEGVGAASGKYKGTIYTSSWTMAGATGADTLAGSVETQKDGEYLRIVADGIDTKVHQQASNEEGILLYWLPGNSPQSHLRARVNLKTDSLEVSKTEGGRSAGNAWYFKGVK